MKGKRGVNLRQMEVFRAIMREGTVTDAAKLLGLSQPSVTELLKHTEAKLGFRLFDRIKGRLRPTSEAHLLFEEVEAIFERVRILRRSSEALRETKLGSLNTATISALGLSFVPSMLGRFLATRPDVRSRLLVKRRFDLIGSIVTEGMDVGFAFQSANDPRVIRQEIMQCGLVSIIPGGHELGRLGRVSVDPDRAGAGPDRFGDRHLGRDRGGNPRGGAVSERAGRQPQLRGREPGS
jgi:DNA-binding transcriptional LysR family regulator